uniref:receptor expression-enhancing protein 1 isoform X2 n=1 Tax=Macaca mulatta TaxID=9544 RepID=UPI0010A2495F|nr:receptor expression-enhancing protein 1 isoform X2 [Macaca mulatta]
MVSWIISRLVVLIFGTLYPAYYSYKAVKSKDIKEYVKWMMYWIIFALFTTAETFTDIFLCWFPFYYELKIAFVAWLLSPYTKGSSLLYRKFVHPTLSSKEKEIDDCLVQAKDRSYDALVHFGKRGLNVAATAAVMAASKLILRRYFQGRRRDDCCPLPRSICFTSLALVSTICWIKEGKDSRKPMFVSSSLREAFPGHCASSHQVSLLSSFFSQVLCVMKLIFRIHHGNHF